MGYQLYISDINDLILESGKHQYAIDKSGIKEVNYSFLHTQFEGGFKEIVFDNFRISYGKGAAINKLHVDFCFEEETVEMHFTINGRTNTFIKGLNDVFSMGENSHNIFYCSEIQGKLNWLTNNMFVFEVNLLPSFFEKYLPNEKVFENFRKHIQKKSPGFMNLQNYPISNQMLLIINQIINCEFKNSFRKLFVESKVLELLMLQLDQIQSFSGMLKTKLISKNTIDRMHYAKDLIAQKIGTPLSLSELSLELNTNECSLKKDFKATFGTTVFGFIKDLKMNKAKQLLLEQSVSIAEVSDLVGYKNPQHFTTAFKKYYGFTPGTLKNS